MSPFEIYLRTGQIDLTPEAKFNPWHDVEDGRFTFRNAGRHWGAGESADHSSGAGRGGGGGSGWGSGGKRKNGKFGGFGGGDFGGGGAGGSWADDRFGGFGGGGGGFDGGGAGGSWEAPKPKPRQAPIRHSPKTSAPVTTHTASPAPRQSQPLTVIRRNGYTYKIDRLHRTREVSGELQREQSRRSRRSQTQAGGQDRRSADDGGHYIAVRFNGPREAFNHFAQDRNFNRGAYREMEGRWGREIAAGRKVHVRIVPEYRGDSQRPFKITVSWTINGRTKVKAYENEHGGGDSER